MKTKRVIVWFRNDLRLLDHEPLAKAIQSSDQIVPIFCWDPRGWEEDAFGHVKTGAFRTHFLWESLRDLDASLRERGSALWILQGKPEELIPQLARQLEASSVFAFKEIGTEEAAVEDALEKKLFAQGIDLKLFWGRTLLNLTDLPMPIRSFPEVFTHFRKEVERSVSVRPLFRTPQHIASPIQEIREHWKRIEAMLPKIPAVSQVGTIKFKGGERAGKARVQEYIWEKDLLKVYKETRNGLLGGDYSSKFSPWLALGCLSPRTLYQEVKEYERNRVKNKSTYWLIFELLWRDYFQFIAHKHGRHLFTRGGIQQTLLPVHPNESKWEAWVSGNTGIPFVDANMRELAQTGFMSNRGRQNVASYLVKDLGQDWRRGASYFEHQLIDYDVSSNWGNWNYVAGVGNDPRKHRYFNVVSQGRRYDPKGDYIKFWVPELASLPSALIHEPWTEPDQVKKYGIELGENYPFSSPFAMSV